MAYCANCGAAVTGRYCPQCGTAVSAANPTPPPASHDVPPTGVPPHPPIAPPIGAPTLGMGANLAGALCYLFGFITGILFLVLAPYNQDRSVRFHAFQSIFLNIAWFVAWIIVGIVTLVFRVIPFLGLFISLVLHFSLGIGALILWLYMMFKTYNGEKVVLPVVGPMAEKQAGL